MKRAFKIVIVPEEDGPGCFVTVPSLPGCFTSAPTAELAVERAQEAIAAHLEALAKSGAPLPGEDAALVRTVEVELAA